MSDKHPVPADNSGEVDAIPTAERKPPIPIAHWSGPLPPPSVFNHYNAEVQSAIIGAFKAENNHRHKNQSKQVDAQITRGNRRQHYSFIVVMASLAVSGGLVYSGRDWGAFIMLGIIPVVVPQIKDILEAWKAFFGGGRKNDDGKQHNSNGHSD
ncbi:MAG: DUF2335 domain-containing protein [Gammaproteobacteria bacterium]